MRVLTVKDLMAKKLILLSAEDDLNKALSTMESHRIRHLPVANNGKLIGLITERYLSRAAILIASETEEGEEAPTSPQVRHFMAEIVQTTWPGELISEAGKRLLDNKYGCLPVVEGDKLVGILTESDFVRYLVTR